MSPADWEAQEPPADFADRVMDGVRREAKATVASRSVRTLRVRVVAGLALAAVAAALLGYFGVAHEKGASVATKREEVHVGRRAIAVLETGAHISWEGDHVTQTAGDAFYRVEPRRLGPSFRVSTPRGDIEVVGTCFSVRLETPEGQVNKRDWKMGSLGAGLGVTVLVSVYEGRVSLSHAAEEMTLTAGQSARASAAGLTRSSGLGESTNADPLLVANANLTGSIAEYKRRLEAIEAQKVTVEKQLKEAKDRLAASDARPTPVRDEYDLSQDDWKDLAKAGEVKARFPCPDADSWNPSPDALSSLGLAPQDAAPIHDAMQESAERIWAAVRPLCVQALDGNAKVADKLGPSICQRFVLGSPDDLSEDTNEEIRKVAAIRAGILPMPSDPGALGLYGQMVYTLSGESKALEQQIAQSLGPDTAHRVVFGPDGESANSCSLHFAQSPRH
jgi:hypothetical protein